MELAKTGGVEGQKAVNDQQVRGKGVAKADLGAADVPREPGKAKCPMVTAGVEGGRSAGTGARATGRGGKTCSEAGGRATSSSRPGGDGSQQSQGVEFTPLRGQLLLVVVVFSPTCRNEQRHHPGR